MTFNEKVYTITENKQNQLTGILNAYTYANAVVTHIEGNANKIEDPFTFCSHMEGNSNTIKNGATMAHVEGTNNIASTTFAHIQGQYNIEDTANEYADIIGWGTDNNNRSNIFTVSTIGNVGATGSFTSTGADYAEFWEWEDGNIDNEDRRGLFVSLNEDKLVKANEGDWILGIISANPSVVGDNYNDEWQGKYQTDVFGNYIFEEVKVPVIERLVDNDGQYIERETDKYTIEKRKKLNPNYDVNKTYISRQKRQEWDYVGNGGKIVMVDDGTCQVNGWCKPASDGTGKATISDKQTKFRVIKRLDDTHIKVWIW